MSATVYLTVFDGRRGIDEVEDDVAAYVSETGLPPLWAGLIPSHLAAEHLEKAVAEWDEWEEESADGVGDSRAEPEDEAEHPAETPDESPSGPSDEGGGFLMIPWTAARAAYLDRLDSFADDQPALAAQAREWIAVLDPVVDAAAAQVGGVDDIWVELDYSLVHDDYATAEEYVETMGRHLAPWVWPGEGLAGHLPAMGDRGARGESWEEKFEREARDGAGPDVSATAPASGPPATSTADAMTRYLPLLPLWLIGGSLALGTRGAVRVAIFAGLVLFSLMITAKPRRATGLGARRPQRHDGPPN